MSTLKEREERLKKLNEELDNKRNAIKEQLVYFLKFSSHTLQEHIKAEKYDNERLSDPEVGDNYDHEPNEEDFSKPDYKTAEERYLEQEDEPQEEEQGGIEQELQQIKKREELQRLKKYEELVEANAENGKS